jgi:hypothetical protein
MSRLGIGVVDLVGSIRPVVADVVGIGDRLVW